MVASVDGDTPAVPLICIGTHTKGSRAPALAGSRGIVAHAPSIWVSKSVVRRLSSVLAIRRAADVCFGKSDDEKTIYR
jgi:hypothetical protein